MARKNSSPTKRELAQFKVLSDLGMTPNAIAVRTERDPKTVRYYLKSEVYNDPDISNMIELIKSREINDLYLLGAKARNRLHDLLDEGNTKVIETVAIQDRSFQQRRLLENQSTENIFSLHETIASVKALYREREQAKQEG